MKNVIGMGNALTDMVVSLPDDSVLERFSLPKGGMVLVDGARLDEISRALAGLPEALSLGGSVANSVRAMARLAAGTPGKNRVGFIGKVGRDSTGDFFSSALDNLGIEGHVFRGTAHSGRCISLVSPDGERTMVTYLGAALELTPGEITPSLFAGFDCLYLEGYLVQNHELILHVARTARTAGLTVAIDLASFNVVESNLSFLRTLVSDHIDILFANEQEAHSFTGLAAPSDALDAIARMCSLAVVKTGTRGALIRRAGETVEVGIMEAARRVDTTGAGDFYAAGFLYGLGQGLSLRACGTIGAIAAGKVIEVVGTTFGPAAWADIDRMVEEVRTERVLF